MTDQQIIDKFAQPEERQLAFKELVNNYQEKLYWHIRKMVINHADADDVLQNVFIRVWKNLDGFRSDSSLYTWLYRIATNECLSFLKQQKRRRIFGNGADNNEALSKLEDDEYFEGDEIQRKLQQALLVLPDKQRLVFNMKYFDEMKYTEMSEILDTSVGALKSSYHHAVKKIEEFLKQSI